jgi:dephospho-CoA kinase
MIIGIAGTLGAGKGTVVEYLKNKGFAHYSSSDVLRRILKERNISAERNNLSELANELMREFDGGVLHYSHHYAKEAGDENYILEALHRVSEGEYIKKIGGIIIGVDADIEVRFARITKRGDGEKDKVTFEQFVADAEREDEGKTGSGPNIRAVMKMADYTITNNGSLEELHQQIDQFLVAEGITTTSL